MKNLRAIFGFTLAAAAPLAAAAGHPYRAAAEADGSEVPPEESRSIRFVCSTETEDRCGRIVVQDWNLGPYAANPILLWNHGVQGDGWAMDSPDLDLTLPIGFASDVAIEDGQLCATLNFVDAKANPLAEKVFQGIKQGSIRAVSVGWTSDDVRYEKHDEREVMVLRKNVLLEISPCSIPANPDAVRASLRAGVNASTVKEKGRMTGARLRAALNLSAAATDEEVMSKAEEVGGFLDTADKALDDARKALGLVNELTEEAGETEPAAAKAAIRAFRVKAAAYDQLLAQTLASEKTQKENKIASIVKDALKAGKFTPANRASYLEVCGGKPGKNGEIDLDTVSLSALEALVKNLPAVANMATQDAEKASANTAGLTKRDLEICARHGFDPAEYAATKATHMNATRSEEEDGE